jgi:seryl-tRNA synthetase
VSQAPLTAIDERKLVDHGWLTQWNAPGVAGFTGQWEAVIDGIQALITASESVPAIDTLNFPPVIARSVIDTTEYADSFPHLLATVKTLDEADAAQYLHETAEGTPEDQLREVSDVVIVPATCYSLYPLVADGGAVPAGKTYSVMGSCFRAEASTELGRFRSFRMREFVYFGDIEATTAWRDRRADVAIEMFAALGMTAEKELANDPFFRPLKRVMAPSQLEQQLKYELVVPIAEDRRIAIASANLHKDHLCDRFEIRGEDDAIATSTCAAFGLERIVLALIAHHGLSPDDWPDQVTTTLNL